MFRIGAVPPALDDAADEVASKIEPSTLGHWQDTGFAHGIHPLTASRHCVGSAFTVRLAGMDATALHVAVDEIGPGHVLVVDMGGDRRRACVGAIIAWLAQERGARGIVIDGMATDLEDLERLTIPVFARGRSAVTTRALGIEGDINVPVVIDHSTVNPGDVVIADPNGVLFIAPEDLAALAGRAVAAQEAEARMRADLRAGARLSDFSDASERMKDRVVTVK
ncbi:RraA family protein [Streptomyces sp. NPDC004610]|uniref:RraA family protein n=1 Tax=unclassified Streptomyces TaxID=2593676 RepID=UPI0033B2110F